VSMIFGGLDAEDYDRSYGDRQLLSRIIRYFAPAKRPMLVVAFLVVCSSLLDAAIPLALARGVNGLTKSRTLTATSVLVGVILTAGALSWTCNFIRQWFTARAVGDVVLQLRLDAFNAVLDRDLSFYDEYPSGRIVSRVTSDTQDFSNVSCKIPRSSSSTKRPRASIR
jgi:ATP-binding cassette, subfamily B, bacterial